MWDTNKCVIMDGPIEPASFDIAEFISAQVDAWWDAAMRYYKTMDRKCEKVLRDRGYGRQVHLFHHAKTRRVRRKNAKRITREVHMEKCSTDPYQMWLVGDDFREVIHE